MDQLTIVTQIAVAQWELHVKRGTQMITQLSDEALTRAIAPGKNPGTYVVGHLIAVHDAMPSILGLGDAKYPELYEMYVKQPDGAAGDPRPVQELRDLWTETHERVTNLLKNLYANDWLLRHNAMTDEDFAANPQRNRLSVLLNRTAHFSYHIGQLRLLNP